MPPKPPPRLRSPEHGDAAAEGEGREEEGAEVRRLIFLDIDGVLNGHKFMREAQSCNICHPCVLELNRIIRLTGARVVLSSAWRYMIHGGAMKLNGFAYMLRTHGFSGIDNIIGLTASDETCPSCCYRHKRKEQTWNTEGFRECVKCGVPATRGAQVTRWLLDNYDPLGLAHVRHVVIDDDAFDFEKLGHPFVQTRPSRGLTRYAADKAIRVLRGRRATFPCP